MKTFDISRLPSMITLGYDGENNWRPNSFDCSSLLANHPNGTITLWLLPKGESQAFPVALEQDANHLTTSIKISAVPEELQDLMLCDTVTVVHPGYGLQQQAKVVKTVYDPIKERYKEITIGEIQKTITDAIAGLLRGGTK